MDPGLAIATVFALAFSTTNGLHDASNAIATLVATRGATPLQAIVMAAIFNLVGPLLVGAAVADTIGGIVTAAPSAAIAVIGSGLAAAVAWTCSRGGWVCRPAPAMRSSAASWERRSPKVACMRSTGVGSRAGTRWALSARSSGWRSRRCSGRWPRCW
jgi:hypothetical protein